MNCSRMGASVCSLAIVPQEHAAKFITKLGTAMPEVSVSKLEAEFPLAFDVDKTVRTAFQKV